ncbi:hypothetical protein B0H19DRAFT_1371420 [Mycena capillaripes]|nr:hypothetical protein B0H19DRAFT_1371420 [Mycena capillaripes]
MERQPLLALAQSPSPPSISVPVSRSPLRHSFTPRGSPSRRRSRGSSTPYATPEASPTRKQETRACTFRLRRMYTRRTLPPERERAHDVRCTIRVAEHDPEPRKDRARASEGGNELRCACEEALGRPRHRSYGLACDPGGEKQPSCTVYGRELAHDRERVHDAMQGHEGDDVVLASVGGDGAAMSGRGAHLPRSVPSTGTKGRTSSSQGSTGRMSEAAQSGHDVRCVAQVGIEALATTWARMGVERGSAKGSELARSIHHIRPSTRANAQRDVHPIGYDIDTESEAVME